MPKNKQKKQKKIEPVFHIFCEGEKTEPYYINGYIDYFHSEHRNIILVEDTNKNTPVQLVETAIKAKESSPDNDVFWVVFDRESIVKYPHKFHIDAKQKAESNGIEIAISNICFEFWLLLHLKYTTAGYINYDDLIKNSELKKLLKEKGLKKDYDKADTQIFALLKNDISKAISNADKVCIRAIDTAEAGKVSPCYFNAYTDFHELLIDMKFFIDKEESIRKLTHEERKEKMKEIIELY